MPWHQRRSPDARPQAPPPPRAPPSLKWHRRSRAPARAPKPRIRHLRLRHRGHGHRASRRGTISTGIANGTWAKNTPIPADKSNYGMFTVLDDLSRERTRADHRGAGEGSEQPDRHRLRAASWTRPRSRRRASRRSSRGSTRSAGSIRKLRLSPTSSADAASSASALRSATFVGQDDKAPDRTCTAMSAGRPRDARPRLLSVQAIPKLAETTAKYLQHLTNMLTLAGEPNASARAKAIVDVRDKIATAQLDPGRKPRREQDLQQAHARRVREARAGIRFPELVKASGAQGDRRSSSPSRRPFTGSRRSSARRRSAALQGPAAGPLARALRAPYLPKAFDDEKLRVLRHDADRARRSRRPAGSAAVELHRRSARRSRRQALRRASTSRRRPRPRPTSWCKNLIAGDGPAHRQARLDERRRRRPRRTPSSPRSRRRSAIPTSGATTRRWRSTRRRPARQRDARRASSSYDCDVGQARQAGRPRRVGHDAADGQRLLQPDDERDRVPGRDPAAAVLRSRTPTTPSTTAASAR